MGVVTNLRTVAGTDKITGRFGKLGITIKVPGTTTEATVFDRASAVLVELVKKHKSYGKIELIEEGSLLKRMEQNAVFQGPVEVSNDGTDTYVKGSILVVYPKRVVGGTPYFGGNVELLDGEDYLLSFSGFANSVAVTVNSIELPGGVATAFVKHAYQNCEGTGWNDVNCMGAEVVVLDKSKLTALNMQFPAGVPGGARTIGYTMEELDDLQNDNRYPIYIIDGKTSTRSRYNYILDCGMAEKAQVKYSSNGSAETLTAIS